MVLAMGNFIRGNNISPSNEQESPRSMGMVNNVSPGSSPRKEPSEVPSHLSSSVMDLKARAALRRA